MYDDLMIMIDVYAFVISFIGLINFYVTIYNNVR